jgi:hypothetical protein
MITTPVLATIDPNTDYILQINVLDYMIGMDLV